MGAVVRVQPVRATVPRRRVLRAWMGLLEDVLGAVGGGPGPGHGNEPAWERFIHCRTLGGRVARETGRVVYEAALW